MNSIARRLSPMLRIAFLCLPLAAAVLFWVRSRSNSDFLAFFGPSGGLQAAATHQGRFILVFSTVSFGRERAITIDYGTATHDEVESLRSLVDEDKLNEKELLGFVYAHAGRTSMPGGAGGLVSLALPMWFVTTLCALFALWRIPPNVRKWRRKRLNLCPACGYDWRTTPGACPECGYGIEGPKTGSGGSNVSIALLILITVGAAVWIASRHAHDGPLEKRQGAMGEHLVLSQTIPEVHLDAVPREKAVERIGALWQVDIKLRDYLVDSPQYAPTVSFHGCNVTLVHAIRAVLHDAIAAEIQLKGSTVFVYENLAIEPVKNGATINGDNASSTLSVRMYDVHDLIQHRAKDTNQAVLAAIVILCTDSIAPESWKTNGGDAGHIVVFRDHLIVRQTEANQRKVQTILGALRPF